MRRLLPVIPLLFASIPVQAAVDTPGRQSIPLNGSWQFRRDGAAENAWKPVAVPSTFQEHEGNEWHGVGWYQRTVQAAPLPPGRRALLHFHAAATHAEVWWDDVRLGEHLGGWTPFRFDVTDLIRKAAGKPNTLRVRVDEKVGHNTQGFLPIIQPHYGGLWLGVELLIVPESYVDDLSLHVRGDPDTGRVIIERPLAQGYYGAAAFAVRYRLRGTTAWTETTARPEPGALRHSFDVPGFRLWSPHDPKFYEIEFAADRAGDDRIATRCAFRKIETRGHQLLLNGQPLIVRGVLNWGYYPPRLAPVPDVPRWSRDLKLTREMGFNLMKFCLWVPPRPFLDLCDEQGILAWVEYPTWHPKLDQKHRAELVREFTEFFAFDRNHPSVILRSLTCETGPSADLAVVRELYDLAKRMIPGCVVEDDSSWIGWQRVHDFYDDHPYGNNHTWVPTLNRLKAHIAKHGAKPLILGEAIAADTWVDPEPLLKQVGDKRPYWLPGFLDGNRKWLERMRSLYGDGGLIGDREYALAMRKHQIETFRREVPDGGYVVSVLRDFPLASMGFLNYDDRPKWHRSDWDWHKEAMCLIDVANDRRSFFDGERVDVRVLLRQPIPNQVHGALVSGGFSRVYGFCGQHDGLFAATPRDFGPWPLTTKSLRVDFRIATAAMRQNLMLSIAQDERVIARNEWPVWVVPRPDVAAQPAIHQHESFPKELAASLLQGTRRDAAKPRIHVARRLDLGLLDQLEVGGTVLLLPDGERGSLPLKEHWFLRGGPYLPPHPLWQSVPPNMIFDLQHFDLAGPVIPDVQYLDQIDPVLLLWDNHDIKEVKTHALVFETKVGKGRLFVSALKHDGATNAAGQWLLAQFLKHVAQGPEPKRALKPETIRRMRDKLREQKIDLTESTWRFRPDPNNDGLQQNWHQPSTKPDASWTDIRVGKHWEGQGHTRLDGWAWYRLDVDVPKGWAGRDVFLSFQGVDDHYEVYVNGKLAGGGGDPAKRQTAFEERTSHAVTALVTPGERCTIAVRVFDWYGAGGIHRPVTLGTAALSPEPDILR